MVEDGDADHFAGNRGKGLRFRRPRLEPDVNTSQLLSRFRRLIPSFRSRPLYTSNLARTLVFIAYDSGLPCEDRTCYLTRSVSYLSSRYSRCNVSPHTIFIQEVLLYMCRTSVLCGIG